MTLDEAIQHCEENIQKEKERCNFACADEHVQLRNWLLQLRDLMEGVVQHE